MKELAPLLFVYCVDYLKERPIGTRYHPKSNEYVLDGKLMARIIRHNGNLRAQITQSEGRFFTTIVNELKDISKIHSPLNNEVFEIREDDRGFNNGYVVARKIKFLNIFNERKAKHVGDIEYVTMVND